MNYFTEASRLLGTIDREALKYNAKVEDNVLEAAVRGQNEAQILGVVASQSYRESNYIRFALRTETFVRGEVVICEHEIAAFGEGLISEIMSSPVKIGDVVFVRGPISKTRRIVVRTLTPLGRCGDIQHVNRVMLLGNIRSASLDRVTVTTSETLPKQLRERPRTEITDHDIVLTNTLQADGIEIGCPVYVEGTLLSDHRIYAPVIIPFISRDREAIPA